LGQKKYKGFIVAILLIKNKDGNYTTPNLARWLSETFKMRIAALPTGK